MAGSSNMHCRDKGWRPAQPSPTGKGAQLRGIQRSGGESESGRTCNVVRVESRMGGFVVEGSGSPVESIRRLAAACTCEAGVECQIFQIFQRNNCCRNKGRNVGV